MTNSHYHDPADKKYGANLRRGAIPEFQAYMSLNEAVRRDDGAIPLKYRELMSIAVAVTTQCVFCIETHVTAARAAGAAENEVAEAIFVAAALRAGGAFAHGRLAMRLFEAAGAGEAVTPDSTANSASGNGSGTQHDGNTS